MKLNTTSATLLTATYEMSMLDIITHLRTLPPESPTDVDSVLHGPDSLTALAHLHSRTPDAFVVKHESDHNKIEFVLTNGYTYTYLLPSDYSEFLDVNIDDPTIYTNATLLTVLNDLTLSPLDMASQRFHNAANVNPTPPPTSELSKLPDTFTSEHLHTQLLHILLLANDSDDEYAARIERDLHNRVLAYCTTSSHIPTMALYSHIALLSNKISFRR